MTEISIRQAVASDAGAIAHLADDLLREIMDLIGVEAFESDPTAMQIQLQHSLPAKKHYILLAEKADLPVGFVALSPAYSLYTNGPFGLITELFVHSDHRSQSIGERLLMECRAFANSMGWTQLEVTTPPLPEFDRTLKFYHDNGFTITGGRKLKLPITKDSGHQPCA